MQRMDKRLSDKGGAARVAPYEALRAEIARRHPEFSNRLKVIAEFALENPTDMALGTVAEVASRAKVQPSAVVRFAHALGYGGFSELQKAFRSRLVASVAPTYKERIAGLRRDGRFRDTNTPHSLLAPVHYEPNYAYPLVIWLHGPCGHEREIRRVGSTPSSGCCTPSHRTMASPRHSRGTRNAPWQPSGSSSQSGTFWICRIRTGARSSRCPSFNAAIRRPT